MELAPDHSAAYDAIIARIVGWATADDRVRAAMIVGSRARTDHPADAWSDLDVVVLGLDPAALLADETWIFQIGTPVISFVQPTAIGGWRERRVLFEGALDVDIAIVPASFLEGGEAGGNAGAMREVASVLQRGLRVLVDKDERLAPVLGSLRSGRAAVDSGPDQATFHDVLNDYWYHVVWTAKKLRRGELVVAHGCLDRELRPLLIRLLRWHAAASGEIWHGTRFIEEWISPETHDALAGTWARHDRTDIVRAIRATMDLASRLGHEVASAYGLVMPSTTDTAGRAWFDAIVLQDMQTS